ncbi:MAG: DUF4381 family protein [Verrucomicrobiaceae bacterium]|nr:DUF4381 family protein [Verrucomicrobiaceae bacterium]
MLVLAQLINPAPGGPDQGPPPLPFPEIDPPPVIKAPLEWWWIALMALILLLACLMLWRKLMAGRPASATAPKRPLQSALRKLRELRSRTDTIPPSETGHGVSEILREYYLNRYGLPAPYRTSEELFPVEAMASESSRRRQWRERFEPLAPAYDRLAYAAVPATSAEAVALVETAIQCLESEITLGGDAA